MPQPVVLVELDRPPLLLILVLNHPKPERIDHFILEVHAQLLLKGDVNIAQRNPGTKIQRTKIVLVNSLVFSLCKQNAAELNVEYPDDISTLDQILGLLLAGHLPLFI